MRLVGFFFGEKHFKEVRDHQYHFCVLKSYNVITRNTRSLHLSMTFPSSDDEFALHKAAPDNRHCRISNVQTARLTRYTDVLSLTCDVIRDGFTQQKVSGGIMCCPCFVHLCSRAARNVPLSTPTSSSKSEICEPTRCPHMPSPHRA